MELTREEFVVHVGLLRDDIHGVHDRLDLLNDRTRGAEQDIAVLKDRSESVRQEAQQTARTSSTRWGLILAGLAALAEALHQYFNR